MIDIRFQTTLSVAMLEVWYLDRDERGFQLTTKSFKNALVQALLNIMSIQRGQDFQG